MLQRELKKDDWIFVSIDLTKREITVSVNGDVDKTVTKTIFEDLADHEAVFPAVSFGGELPLLIKSLSKDTPRTLHQRRSELLNSPST